MGLHGPHIALLAESSGFDIAFFGADDRLRYSVLSLGDIAVSCSRGRIVFHRHSGGGLLNGKMNVVGCQLTAATGFLIEVMEKLPSHVSCGMVANQSEGIASVANLDFQPLFDVSEVFVELPAECC